MLSSGSVLRAGGLFVAFSLGLITVICAAFFLLAAPIPEWFVVVGRWLPAIVAALVIRMVGLPGIALHWFKLRPGGGRQLLIGSVATVAALLVVYALSAAAVVALGIAVPQPWSAFGQVAILLIPVVLVFSLSTLGEEVAWRGFLQEVFRGWGFWRAAMAVAAIWVLFHVPLHATMAAQGTIPGIVALTSTLGLFPLGIFLSAAVRRFGSVWPAVFGHALPFTALNLLSHVEALPVRGHWTITASTAVLLLVAAYLFTPRSVRASTGGGLTSGAGRAGVQLDA